MWIDGKQRSNLYAAEESLFVYDDPAVENGRQYIAVVDVSDSTVTFKTKPEDSSDYSLIAFDINTKNVVKYEMDLSQTIKENSENYDNMEVSKCVSKYSISIKKGGTLKTITENDKESAKDLMEVIPSEIIDYIKNMRDDDYLK